jgi:peptidoglycan/LPS O-acetylase OafA/YrhL
MSESVFEATRTVGRYHQLDYVKGLAILSVVLMHTIVSHLDHIYAAFHIWQAVPVFFVVAGMTSAISARSSATLPDFYSLQRLARHARRILVPFAVVCAVELALLFGRGELSLGRIFTVPIKGGLGPGCFFTPAIIQHLLLFPLVIWVIRRARRAPPWVTLAAFFALSLALDWLCIAADASPGIYQRLYVRYLFAAVLGYYLVTHPFRSVTGLLAAGFGALYIGIVQHGGYELGMLSELSIRYPDWSFQHAPAYLYTAALVAALWKLSPSSSLPARGLEVLGRASFHIFLFQMAYFWQFGRPGPDTPAFRIPLDIVICITAGIAFYRGQMKVDGLLEARLARHRQSRSPS